MTDTKKYAYIDAMRGMAILMVILVHTSQSIADKTSFVANAALGQFGVQLFFVASALTLCMSYEQRLNDKHRLVSFFLRRWFRIAPLYFIGILLYFLISAYRELYLGLFYDFFQNYSLFNILSNIFLLHGLIPSANNNVVPGGWSIGTEALFYLTFPALYWWLDSIHRILFVWGVYMAILLLLALIGALHVSNNTFTYFSILIQLPVFISGFLLYRLRHITQHPLLASGMWICLVAFLILWYYWRLQPVRFLLLPALSGLLFCFVGLHLARLTHIPRFISEIGRRSYSMYIFHFLAAWHLVPLLDTRITGALGGNLSLLINFFVATILTFWLSGYSFKYLEKYFVAKGNQFIEKRFQ
ncbi:MAG: acyltransferase [Gallionellaceae bacterium]|nr:acyltransferase [Gallionellaceae bacterium]